MKSDPEKVRGVYYDGPPRCCAQLGCVASAARIVMGANGRRQYLCATHAAKKGKPMFGRAACPS